LPQPHPAELDARAIATSAEALGESTGELSVMETSRTKYFPELKAQNGLPVSWTPLLYREPAVEHGRTPFTSFAWSNTNCSGDPLDEVAESSRIFSNWPRQTGLKGRVIDRRIPCFAFFH